MTELYFGRHGQSQMNLSVELVGGQSNHSPLSPLGELQAQTLGLYLADSNIEFDAAYSSTAKRAYDTAKIALEAAGIVLPIEQDEALLEMSQGDAEGRLRTEIYTEAVIEAIRLQLLDFALPGGESIRQVGERVLAWILEAEHKHPNQTLFVASHGLAIRSAAGLSLGWTHPEIIGYETKNASLTKFEVEDGKIHVPFIGKDVISSLMNK